MQNVKFRTNLGRHTASQLGLDCTKCTYESELEVSDETAVELVNAGIASLATPVKTIKGVPDLPTIAGVAPVTRDAETESTAETKPKKSPMPSPKK